ncbi:hypothetical protein [Yinghuangia soli]|uniref:Tetratricopeptide repeat protein n=1 Tax=Yinghuangia soli TaxID=2908204 RepID=A0AA41QAV4_9ACTN|nr:hypothetical protein [Yinghuangia soli]MCF2533544.1 hypothetical protein [Yinghuangia soli]
MTTELDTAWQLVEAGDIGGVMRHLRFTAEQIPLPDLAKVVAKAADAAGFAELDEAGRGLAAEPGEPQRLYDFGYACLEHGIAFAAIPALREAVRLVPDSRAARAELGAAYENTHRHRDAADLLDDAGPDLPDWPERYLVAYNRLLAGDADRARRAFAALDAPGDDKWSWAHGRLQRMLVRADAAQRAGGLDETDLRGWQFTLTGGILAELSPFGFAQGMTGRYAFQQDSFASCRSGLARLRLILAAAGRTPSAVSLPDERGARIMGLAAAEVLGLPAVPYEPGRGGTLVVAYRIGDLDEDTQRSLRERAAGQVLYEHASCWTDPPPVAADVIGLLRQTGSAPWESQLGAGPEAGAVDERPEAAVAADIVAADSARDSGDGETPPDTDDTVAAFAAAVASAWLTGTRDRVDSPGPVRSSQPRSPRRLGARSPPRRRGGGPTALLASSPALPVVSAIVARSGRGGLPGPRMPRDG